MGDDRVTVLLGGDVMLGRGVDQILPYPGDPRLWERHVKDARDYVTLAERANGPIPRPVEFSWPWGDALDVIAEAAPDARILNLETSVTTSGDVDPGKEVHYRMHPPNVPTLQAVDPHVCTLANNHVLDFGRAGLLETLDALARAGIPAAGAGADAEDARGPAVVADGRVAAFAVGTPSSGVPAPWAAGPDRPGVWYLPDLSDRACAEVVETVGRLRPARSCAILSIHWGSNWGYGVPREQVRFAHGLIDGGVDVVFGHSSHHPRPVEIYRGKLILYGVGDLVDDYEGITGYERYRDDLRLLWLVGLERGSGRLTGLAMTTMRSRRMRLELAPGDDVEWMRRGLDRASRAFGVRVEAGDRGALYAGPA